MKIALYLKSQLFLESSALTNNKTVSTQNSELGSAKRSWQELTFLIVNREIKCKLLAQDLLQ